MVIINNIRREIVNIPGWRTKRKIVVIESDDWGSIRTSRSNALNVFRNIGLQVDRNYFTMFDSLENQKDLELLFGLLLSFKDYKGNHPTITANAVLANPDFEKIRKDRFDQYYFEEVTDTYTRYYGNSKIIETWKQGMESRLIWPQFHGREHLNVWDWMAVLRAGNHQEIAAFDQHCILGIGNMAASKRPNEYMAAFSFESDEEKNTHHQIIMEGLNLFERIFGFRSDSFIAPCGVHPVHLDKILNESGVQYIQGGRQYFPDKNGALFPVNRFWGYRNSENQYFWRRNATFEPSRNPEFDWVNSVMSEIKRAFRWGKPAVINSHRVNYMGSLDPRNRDHTLRLLKQLMIEILKKYPEVEFMSSNQLGDLISKHNKLR